MSVYQEILNWSINKPLFIKDALRRIVSNSSITDQDINDLVLLVKKENGDTNVSLNAVPINNTHIPTTVATGSEYPKLLSIKSPININALHAEANLPFLNTGLNVVYGNNGSGKSSYSRILKKLCWSRNSNIELKKNVFDPTNEKQSVYLTIEISGANEEYHWEENNDPHSALSAINVFDKQCGDVYLSGENPTDYKPIGIDLLERLIPILNCISEKLSIEASRYNSQKPNLSDSLKETQSGRWYAAIESLARTEVNSYIDFNLNQVERKNELSELLNTQNPQETIRNLTNLKPRIENYKQHFIEIEVLFSQQRLDEIRDLRDSYINIKKAYDIATNDLKKFNTIDGFGSNPWRELWDAAKNFAITNGLTNGDSFPSDLSLEKCVLCQQNLNEDAKDRLLNFNQFVSNNLSTRLNAVQQEIQKETLNYNELQAVSKENYAELNHYITDFQNVLNSFNQKMVSARNSILEFLMNGGEFNTSIEVISTLFNPLISNIDRQIDQNNQLLQNRNTLIDEYNELLAREFLYNSKTSILQYFDEINYKSWIENCKRQLSTNGISRKIGELMSDQAVELQHQEFIRHLNSFNTDLSSRVHISKTRTSLGNTFQKCSLHGLSDSINSILSEGEQKIIALANFLADCTIDNRKNSIVFDDPVTSLDMDYRELIANKIIELSADRQIIILTHDLSFLRLLIDIHKDTLSRDCHIIGIDKYNGISGIVTDEIPYLAKNVDERIDSIRRILREHDSLNIADTHGRETKLDSAHKRFRMLLERSVEEILANKTYERFSKNIKFKKNNLSSFIVADQNDIDFLLDLYGKYSVTEHDGGTSTIPLLPTRPIIEQDIREYMSWKNDFRDKLRILRQTYN